MKKYYPWIVCLACAMLFFCLAGLSVNAFSTYSPFLLSELGFSKTQVSLLTTVRGLAIMLALLAVEKYYKRVSLRTGLMLAAWMTVMAHVLFGLTKHYAVFLVGSALVGGACGLGTMVPVSLLLERWFIQKRTLAMSLVAATSGLATIGIPSLVTGVIERWGMTVAFLGEAAAIALITSIGCLLLRNDPSELDTLPLGGGDMPGPAQTGTEAAQRPQGAVLSRRTMWIALSALFLSGVLLNPAYAHLTLLVSAKGCPSNIVALTMSVAGTATLLAKFVFGWGAEKFTVYRVSQIFLLVMVGGGILLCCSGDRLPLIFLGVFLFCGPFGAITVCQVSWAGDWSTRDTYATLVSRFQLASSVGGLCFSPVPGIVADLVGGSYVPSYVLFTLFAVYILFAVTFVYTAADRAAQKS